MRSIPRILTIKIEPVGKLGTKLPFAIAAFAANFALDWRLLADNWRVTLKLHSESEESDEFCERSALCSFTSAVRETL